MSEFVPEWEYRPRRDFKLIRIADDSKPESEKDLEHFSERGLGNYRIGIFGMGGLGNYSLTQFMRLKKSELHSRVSNIFLATSRVDETKRFIDDDARVTATSEMKKVPITPLPIDWGLDDLVSDETLRTFTNETDIVVLTAEDKAEYARLCDENKINPKKAPNREMLTKANIKWVKKIAPYFDDYKGIVVVASNLTDSLVHAFASHSAINPNQVVGMNHVDTMRLRAWLDKDKEWEWFIQKLQGDGLTQKYINLRDPSKGNCKLAAYAIGAHDNPHAIIFLNNERVDNQLTERTREKVAERLNARVKNWAKKLVDRAGFERANDQSGRAVAETLASIMDGKVPICCSTFVDSKIESERGYIGLPAIFDLDENRRPRPYTIQAWNNTVFEDAIFLDIFGSQRKVIDALRKDGMIGEDLTRTGIDKKVMDLGYLYISGIEEGKRGLKEYRVCNEKKGEIPHLNFISADEIENFNGLAGVDKNNVYCISGRQSKTDPQNYVHVLKNMKITNSIGPIKKPIKGLKPQDGKIYVSIGYEGGDKVVPLDPEKAYSQDELEEIIENAPLLPEKIISFDVKKKESETLIYVCNLYGEVYIHNSNLARVSETPFAQCSPEIVGIRAMEGENLIIGYNHKSATFFGEKGKQRSFQVNPKTIATDVYNGRIRVLKCTKEGLELSQFGSSDELLDKSNKGEIIGENKDISAKTIRAVGLHPENELHKGFAFAYVVGNKIEVYDDRNMSHVNTFQLGNVNLGRMILWRGK